MSVLALQEPPDWSMRFMIFIFIASDYCFNLYCYFKSLFWVIIIFPLILRICNVQMTYAYKGWGRLLQRCNSFWNYVSILFYAVHTVCIIICISLNIFYHIQITGNVEDHRLSLGNNIQKKYIHLNNMIVTL